MSFTKLANKKKPNQILIELVEFMNCSSGNALDIGAGPLVETSYLLESGYAVDAIDKDPASASVAKEIKSEKFHFFNEDIAHFYFKDKEYNLVLSLFTLPFISPDNFYGVFQRIINSVKDGGYVCISLFGDRDEWANTSTKMTFLTKQKVEALFDSFDIIRFIEEDRKRPTVGGKMKKWHTFTIVAKKITK